MVLLQLSDLHIIDNTEWSLMQNDLFQIILYRPDYVFFTGDLHNYGDDYEKTIDFIVSFCKEFKIPGERLFFVPGNHDCEHILNKESMVEDVKNNIDKDQDYYLKYDFSPCFVKYNEFLDTLYSRLGCENPYHGIGHEVLVRKDENFNIVHLNTSLTCNGNNDDPIIFDVFGCKDFDKEIREDIPTIVIGHHSFNSIQDNHRKTLVRFLTNWKVSAYLCGDMHKQSECRINIQTSPKDTIPGIVCPKATPEAGDDYSDVGFLLHSVYDRFEDDKRFQPIWVDVTVYSYIWDKEKKHYIQDHHLDYDDQIPLIYPLIRTVRISKEQQRKMREHTKRLRRKEVIKSVLSFLFFGAIMSIMLYLGLNVDKLKEKNTNIQPEASRESTIEESSSTVSLQAKNNDLQDVLSLESLYPYSDNLKEPKYRMPLYTGPGKNYYRRDTAISYSKRGARLFGRKKEWIFIRQEFTLNDKRTYVYGWVDESAFAPSDLKDIEDIEFNNYEWVTTKSSFFREGESESAYLICEIAEGKTVRVLARIVDEQHKEFAYCEYELENGQLARGFIPSDALSEQAGGHDDE